MATSSAPLFTPNVTLQAARGSSTPSGPSEPDLTLPAGNIVSDDFSSGDLDATGPSGEFTWGNSGNQRFTSLVTMDPATGDPTVILTSGGTQTYNVLTGDPRDWTALHGANCLRFAYVAGGDAEVFSEQRWSLVGTRKPTLWFRAAFRVPTNFIHENVAGSPTTSNNKLFAIWQDAYSFDGTGANVWMEFQMNGTGGSSWYCKESGTDSSADRGKVPFITYPDDQGRWMYICAKLVIESSSGASDGSFTVWRKWANGVDTWEKTHELLNRPYSAPTNGDAPGWGGGYLMGADNSGYAEDTEWLLDDFNLSTGSLL